MRSPWRKAQAPASTKPAETQQSAVETGADAGGDFTVVEGSEQEKNTLAQSLRVDTSEAIHSNFSEGAPNVAATAGNGIDEFPRTGKREHSGSDDDHEEKTEPISTTLTKTTTSSSAEGPEDESKYPKGIALYLLTFGLCLGTFVVALDNTIIATAIPRITTVFDSLDDIGWYGSAYLLTTASLQPSLGKVYTFFSVKLTYVISVAVFELGSVLCGAATSSSMLIIGRAIAGAGASGIFSGGLTIVGYSVPLRNRSIYIALVSSMWGIASIVGPILGGAFTDKVSWRWCFYINLPIGALCVGAVLTFFKNPDRRESRLNLKEKVLELDLLGAGFLISAVVCLLLALQWGGSTYPWSDSKVWGCFLGFALIIAVFLVIQAKRGDRATLPPRVVVRQRTVLAVALFSFCLSLSLYVIVYCKYHQSLPSPNTDKMLDVPIWFQAVRGTSAQTSGIRTIPFLLSNILAAIPVGALVSKVGYYTPFIWIGSALFPVGAGLLYLLKVNSGAGEWIGYQILAGVAAGICVQLPFVAVQTVLSKKDMATGNAVAVFFNSMGGAIGVSIAENIFSNQLIKQIPRHAPTANVAVVIAAGATHFRDVVTKEQLPGVLLAYNIAVTRCFLIGVASSVIAFFLSFLFEMKSVKGKAIMAGGGA